MRRAHRRDALLGAGVAGAGSLLAPLSPAPACGGNGRAPGRTAGARIAWRRGLDNQRIADLGDGSFLNPVISGDRPDPATFAADVWFHMTGGDLSRPIAKPRPGLYAAGRGEARCRDFRSTALDE